VSMIQSSETSVVSRRQAAGTSCALAVKGHQLGIQLVERRHRQSQASGTDSTGAANGALLTGTGLFLASTSVHDPEQSAARSGPRGLLTDALSSSLDRTDRVADRDGGVEVETLAEGDASPSG